MKPRTRLSAYPRMQGGEGRINECGSLPFREINVNAGSARLSYHNRTVPRIVHNRNGPLICLRDSMQKTSVSLLKAQSPRMIGGGGKAATESRGWGRGGRGSVPSLAQRCRSRLQFGEHQTVVAIVNRQLPGLVFPHQHAVLGRNFGSARPFELQQSILVAHHPVLADHAFLLQLEDFVQLSRRRSSPVIISCRRCGVRVTPVVVGEIVRVQILIGCVVVGDSSQTQFLRQAVLMRAVRPLHSPFGWRRTGGDDLGAQLRAHASELRHRRLSAHALLGVGWPHVDVLPVGVERLGCPVAFDPAPQHRHRCLDRLLRRKPAQRFRRGIIDHVHQTAARSAFFQPLVKASIQLH